MMRYQEHAVSSEAINLFHDTYRDRYGVSWLPLIAKGLKTVLAHRGASSDKGLLRQYIEILAFTAKYRVHPRSYYHHELHKNWHQRNGYIFHDEIVTVLRNLNETVAANDSAELEDKRSFFKRSQNAGLPCVPILAEFEGGVMVNNADDDRLCQRDLFSKFANRYCGEGATAWRYSDGQYEASFGSFNIDKLRAYLTQTSSDYPIVLQPRIFNHDELQPLSGRALSTVRVVTAKRRTGTAEIVLTTFRMATGKSDADNFAVGGLAAPVSLDTGMLGSAVFKDRSRTNQRFGAHPDTGAQINGRIIPYWQAVKDLALAAHEVFATMPSVGWDIAVTNDGVILLEGNGVWCVELIQMSHDRPLIETSVPEIFAEYLRHARTV
jgi:hypothetical protein